MVTWHSRGKKIVFTSWLSIVCFCGRNCVGFSIISHRELDVLTLKSIKLISVSRTIDDKDDNEDNDDSNGFLTCGMMPWFWSCCFSRAFSCCSASTWGFWSFWAGNDDGNCDFEQRKGNHGDFDVRAVMMVNPPDLKDVHFRRRCPETEQSEDWQTFELRAKIRVSLFLYLFLYRCLWIF